MINTSKESKLEQINKKMKNKQNTLNQFNRKVKQQITKSKNQTKKKIWGIESHQKKIINETDVMNDYTNSQKQQLGDNFASVKAPWEFHKPRQTINTNICPAAMYYPPNCSGYDMTYCKAESSIYIYGGISCENNLTQGIKTFFYKFYKNKWTQVKPQSMYCPTPRYGHSFNCYQKDLILFGGVSQYKQKLKDRCFYSDISVFNTQKSQWRILQTTGNFAKTRKNHATSVLGKYLFIYGGINENEQVIKELSWINYEQKKPRWKSISLQPRFNHKMISIQANGKDFLVTFGGRNELSEIVSTLFFIPVIQGDGNIVLKDPIKVLHDVSPRENPLLCRFSQGFFIMGGVDDDNLVVSDSWYYHTEKQVIEKTELHLNFADLRGCQAINISSQKIYVLATNSQEYKAIEIQLAK